MYGAGGQSGRRHASAPDVERCRSHLPLSPSALVTIPECEEMPQKTRAGYRSGLLRTSSSPRYSSNYPPGRYKHPIHDERLVIEETGCPVPTVGYPSVISRSASETRTPQTVLPCGSIPLRAAMCPPPDFVGANIIRISPSVFASTLYRGHKVRERAG